MHSQASLGSTLTILDETRRVPRFLTAKLSHKTSLPFSVDRLPPPSGQSLSFPGHPAST